MAADKDQRRHRRSDIKTERQKNNVLEEDRKAAGKSALQRRRRCREGG